MSMVFGRQKDMVSKSWSDMWDEDIEEDEEEHERQLQALKELNARSWSQESKEDATPSQPDQVSAKAQVSGDEEPEASPVDDTFSDIDGDLVADGFFFHEPAPSKPSEDLGHHYSPPPKRTGMDKWAALGERRRGINAAAAPSEKRSAPLGYLDEVTTNWIWI
ncbi:hypothetical protein PG987_002555 [Apiospora arundinis]